MLSWLPRRHAKIEIEAEAEALVRDFGEVAYSEACRREHEASSHAIARDWGSVALTVALTPRKPQSLPELTPEAELTRVIAPTTHPFRIQFVGAAPDRGPTPLREVEIRVPDVSAAIVAAANISWPPRTIGVRILDDKGREVFKRQKAHRR